MEAVAQRAAFRSKGLYVWSRTAGCVDSGPNQAPPIRPSQVRKIYPVSSTWANRARVAVPATTVGISRRSFLDPMLVRQLRELTPGGEDQGRYRAVCRADLRRSRTRKGNQGH
jgi:hypothetical protein